MEMEGMIIATNGDEIRRLVRLHREEMARRRKEGLKLGPEELTLLVVYANEELGRQVETGDRDLALISITALLAIREELEGIVARN